MHNRHVLPHSQPVSPGSPGPYADTGRHVAQAMMISKCPSSRITKRVARAVVQLAHVGNPLTPTGYVVLVVIVTAIGLAGMLSSSSLSNELGRALRLSWWFSGMELGLSRLARNRKSTVFPLR